MKATNKLRFVERKDFTQDAANPRTLRILQQWWEVENSTDALHNNVLDGDWRDVPVETEA